jgi:hypothetical protein
MNAMRRVVLDAMWEKQWDRVKRRYARLELMNTPREHTSPTADYPDDDFQAFFMDCFHLKDWLKNDSATGLSSKEVEVTVTTSSVLGLCGDLANGSKHLLLTTPRVDPHAKLGGRLIKVAHQAGGGTPHPTTIAYSYKVEALGKTIDAFELATACMAEWESFLKSKSLITT